MLNKESLTYVSDNTNVRWIKIFHLYRGFHRKSTKIGCFVKGSSYVVEPPKIYYKGYKYKFKIKGDIVRSIIIRTKLKSSKKDNTTILLGDNGVILINKKFNVVSKYLYGISSSLNCRKKLLTLFKLTL